MQDQACPRIADICTDKDRGTDTDTDIRHFILKLHLPNKCRATPVKAVDSQRDDESHLGL